SCTSVAKLAGVGEMGGDQFSTRSQDVALENKSTFWRIGRKMVPLIWVERPQFRLSHISHSIKTYIAIMMRTIFILFLFGPMLAYGQHVFLHFQDGSTHSYEILDVLSTTANGSELDFTFIDGTMLSYSFVDLKRIQHGDTST